MSFYDFVSSVRKKATWYILYIYFLLDLGQSMFLDRNFFILFLFFWFFAPEIFKPVVSSYSQ